MIKVDRLTKVYDDKVAVSDVTFEVASGEILGFLGPNGAGKTTTMRILAGFMPATSGTASIDGHDVFQDSLEARREIGYLPENVPLYPEMTVRSYLNYMAALWGVPARYRRSRVADSAERCRVTDVIDTRIGKLSKGYRQRVGLAQAIVHDPKVLILDEPTVGLDPRQITETRALIKALGGDHTIILSTHILPEVSVTCERVIVIDDGALIAQDTVENLTRRGSGGQSIEIEVDGPADEIALRLSRVRGIAVTGRSRGTRGSRFTIDAEAVNDARPDLARLIVQSGWDLLEMNLVKHSLEEVFLKLLSHDAEVDGEPDRDAESPALTERRARVKGGKSPR